MLSVTNLQSLIFIGSKKMMNHDQLVVEIAQLQQQIEQVNQRLDMIYGAVTRLAESKATVQLSAADSSASEWSAPLPPAAAGMSFSTQALLDPGSMLASLHQHAVNAGLMVATDSVERLQAELPTGEVKDDSH
jgi:hypothetical protein